VKAPNLDFACGLMGACEPGSGRLVMPIVAWGCDKSSGVAPVGRAFLWPVGCFILSG
jgi:hypothetical protein